MILSAASNIHEFTMRSNQWISRKVSLMPLRIKQTPTGFDWSDE